MTELIARLAIVGDHNPDERAHRRLDALADAPGTVGARMEWVATDSITAPENLAGFDGIWVVPGSPYRSLHGALTAIAVARTRDVPYLGTCGGFQHALIDHARTHAAVPEAGDIQYGIDPDDAIVTPLSCSMRGEWAPLVVHPGTVLATIYRDCAEPITELYHCSYGLDPERAEEILVPPLQVGAVDAQGATRAIERPDLTFFVATLFQPELVSDPGRLHPLVTAFFQAVINHHTVRTRLEGASR